MSIEEKYLPFLSSSLQQKIGKRLETLRRFHHRPYRLHGRCQDLNTDSCYSNMDYSFNGRYYHGNGIELYKSLGSAHIPSYNIFQMYISYRGLGWYLFKSSRSNGFIFSSPSNPESMLDWLSVLIRSSSIRLLPRTTEA